VKEGGRTRKISTQEGALLVLREKALKGDARALDRLLGFAGQYNNEPGETAAQASAVIVPMPSRSGGPLKRIKLHRRPETSADDEGHK
jgi:hypothetical protein